MHAFKAEPVCCALCVYRLCGSNSGGLLYCNLAFQGGWLTLCSNYKSMIQLFSPVLLGLRTLDFQTFVQNINISHFFQKALPFLQHFTLSLVQYLPQGTWNWRTGMSVTEARMTLFPSDLLHYCVSTVHVDNKLIIAWETNGLITSNWWTIPPELRSSSLHLSRLGICLVVLGSYHVGHVQ